MRKPDELSLDDVTKNAEVLVFLHRSDLDSRRALHQVWDLQEMVGLPFFVLWVDEPEPASIAQALGLHCVPTWMVTRKGAHVITFFEGPIQGDLTKWLDYVFQLLVKDACALTGRLEPAKV